MLLRVVWLLVGGTALVTAPGGRPAAHAPAHPSFRSSVADRSPRPPRPAQRLDPHPPSRIDVVESEHFTFQFDPDRVTRAEAERARTLAEESWEYCKGRFETTVSRKIRFDLTPNFLGATGFAVPADDTPGRFGRGGPRIGVRYSELQYLGLPAEYVVRHEVAHIFSGGLAGSTLGEGVADWAAGTFRGLPMRQWWGAALRRAGLWIDPEAFFITGDFQPSAELDAQSRSARYAESALLIHFLVERFGWSRTRAFLEEYSKVRGNLDSNVERVRAAEQQRRGRGTPAPPDADRVRRVFTQLLDVSWQELRTEWEAAMDRETPPGRDAERLVLAHRIYGAIRNWEMWWIGQRRAPAVERRDEVREAFTRANQLVDAGEFGAARTELARAERLVDLLRRPTIMARVERRAEIRDNSARDGV